MIDPIAIVADCELLCVNCAYTEYGNLGNLKRAVADARRMSSHGYSGTLADREHGHRASTYGCVRDNDCTARQIFVHGAWNDAMRDNHGETISACGDYHNTLESPDMMYCGVCSVVLDTIICHASESDLACYDMPACICEDCVDAWYNSDDAAPYTPVVAPEIAERRRIYMDVMYQRRAFMAGEDLT
jgi:hypothetical protein